MVFRNERTYQNLVEAGKVEEFHARYEAAVDAVRARFGATHPMLIGGEEVWAEETFPDTCPADTSLVLGRFPKGTREDARRAIAAAKEAFPSWSRRPYEERVAVFLQAADAMAGRKYELAALMSFENGKNRYEAVADVDEAIDFARWYGEEMRAHDGFDHEMGRYYANERTRSVLRPYGVWAVIGPFNFPAAIFAGMTVGATITGNTAVAKPASDAPFVGLEVVRILHEAGLPPGVVNFVTGPGSTVGNELVEHPDVEGLVFTGSREVGTASFRKFTKDRAKPIITEMGGKNPTVVTAKADLEKAAEGVLKAAFGYGGQKCSACARVLVHRDVHEAFVERLVKATKALVVGDPTKRETFLGPVINEQAVETFRRGVAKAREDGEVLVGGRVLTDGAYGKGHFVEATVVAGLPWDHPLNLEEHFVPFLSVIPFETLDEALDIANAVDYGLTAGIFSEDEEEIRRFFAGIEAGVVYANRTAGATTGAVVGVQPFGGWKMSTSTGKAAGGRYYLQQFLREQSQTTYRKE
jgi:1-pyrroline-5-carboxylate dehydrogenase